MAVPPTTSGKRPLVVCGLEVCDELNEGNAYVDVCDGVFKDEMTGATLLRDDVGKARAEEMACETGWEPAKR